MKKEVLLFQISDTYSYEGKKQDILSGAVPFFFSEVFKYQRDDTDGIYILSNRSFFV